MQYQQLLDEKFRSEFIKDNSKDLLGILDNAPQATRQYSLSEWNEDFIYPFDTEAIEKHWVSTAFQDVLGIIWDYSRKSMTWAPREHLKTHTALSYILKRIYERTYPLEINYYHISDETAAEKFRKMQRIAERNPLLYENFDIAHARSWKEDRIELSDGTIILPMSYQSGSVGKHPHIIILDDVIDYRVIYSDERNSKSITSFYANIYPQISKDDPDRKIIAIGTAQRKNDLYNSFPQDFTLHRYAAIKENGQPLSPEIFTIESLEKIKADISSKQGERFWQKEYMNIPFEASGLIVKTGDIQYYTQIDSTTLPFIQKFQGWDLSVGKDIEKGDWTVCCTIGVDRREQYKLGGKIKIYVMDIYRARIDFAKRVNQIPLQYQAFRPAAIGIESVAFQYDTIQEARSRTMLPIVEVKAVINKVQSFQVEVGPFFENKQVYILAGQPWTDLFVNEMLSLPVGEFDDQADAFKIACKTALVGAYGELPDQSLGEDSSTGEPNFEPPIFAGLLER